MGGSQGGAGLFGALGLRTGPPRLLRPEMGARTRHSRVGLVAHGEPFAEQLPFLFTRRRGGRGDGLHREATVSVHTFTLGGHEDCGDAVANSGSLKRKGSKVAQAVRQRPLADSSRAWNFAGILAVR